jgi:hypothetical protein
MSLMVGIACAGTSVLGTCSFIKSDGKYKKFIGHVILRLLSFSKVGANGVGASQCVHSFK